jgi:hypothetical protein
MNSFDQFLPLHNRTAHLEQTGICVQLALSLSSHDHTVA